MHLRAGLLLAQRRRAARRGDLVERLQMSQQQSVWFNRSPDGDTEPGVFFLRLWPPLDPQSVPHPSLWPPLDPRSIPHPSRR